MERNCLRQNKKLTKSHSINYEIIYNYLDQYKFVKLEDLKIK